ncbi:hypothetical protein K1719_033526 [Acacia pycnantha]|nr:hypothetical protein K1719_033526 [Acacia pycnantha]
MSQLELEDEVQDDLKLATGEFTKDTNDENKMNRILQLTGSNQEDSSKFVFGVGNMGDLKLVERPQNYTLTPESSKQIKANIMVSSTETGVIFGNIVYLWTQCKWENKVAVNTVIQDEREFLNHILKCTSMKCLTPPSALDRECGFLGANLYGKIVFGEEAFVNISIEKQADDKLSGFIRIKSENRGISRSLADKITLKQRGGT